MPLEYLIIIKYVEQFFEGQKNINMKKHKNLEIYIVYRDFFIDTNNIEYFKLTGYDFIRAHYLSNNPTIYIALIFKIYYCNT